MAMRIDDLALLDKAIAWRDAGQRVFWVTVVDTWGGGPRPPGASMVVRADGQLCGSVSGGCVEDDIAAWVHTQTQPLTHPHWLHFGISDSGARRAGLSCGGKLAVLVEELYDLHWALAWRKLLLARSNCVRYVSLTGRAVEVQALAVSAGLPPQVRDGRLEIYSVPTWCLLLIGAGQLAHQVAHFALPLDYRVIVCEPRVEYAQSWGLVDVELTPQMPDDAVRQFIRDAQCAVLALTHDPRLDDMGLCEALISPAFYIGALGSRLSAARRRERLQAMGLHAEAIARLHGPAGLPLGGRATSEIALSMMAEITAHRYDRAHTISPALALSSPEPC